ncbi:MAG: molecular chaperone [Planctomycetota bacterium]
MSDDPDAERILERAASAQGRREAYAWLAAAFAQPPAPEMLDRATREGFPPEADGGPPADAVGALRAPAARDDPVDAVAALKQEFMDLFKVPGGRYVTPYESVFRDERQVGTKRVQGLLMGRPAVDVQKWYRLATLRISGSFEDLPDHVSLELAFMAELCAKEADFAASGKAGLLHRAQEMQRDFLAGHLALWMDDLAARIEEKAELPYFPGVAAWTRTRVRGDLALLEDLLGPSSSASAPEYKTAPV